MNQQLPLICVSRGPVASPESVEDVYHFLEARVAGRPWTGQSLRDDEAVLVFRGLQQKVFVEGIHVSYPNGAGEERRELWEDAQGLFRYDLADTGFRELNRVSAERLEAEREALYEWMRRRMNQGCACTPYDSWETCDNPNKRG